MKDVFKIIVGLLIFDFIGYSLFEYVSTEIEKEGIKMVFGVVTLGTVFYLFMKVVKWVK